MGCEFFVSRAVFHIGRRRISFPIITITASRRLHNSGSDDLYRDSLRVAQDTGIPEMARDLYSQVDGERPSPFGKLTTRKSIRLCEQIIAEIWNFSNELNLPVGFNIESVSTRKVEIEAATELVGIAKRIMGR